MTVNGQRVVKDSDQILPILAAFSQLNRHGVLIFQIVSAMRMMGLAVDLYVHLIEALFSLPETSHAARPVAPHLGS